MEEELEGEGEGGGGEEKGGVFGEGGGGWRRGEGRERVEGRRKREERNGDSALGLGTRPPIWSQRVGGKGRGQRQVYPSSSQMRAVWHPPIPGMLTMSADISHRFCKDTQKEVDVWVLCGDGEMKEGCVSTLREGTVTHGRCCPWSKKQKLEAECTRHTQQGWDFEQPNLFWRPWEALEKL